MSLTFFCAYTLLAWSAIYSNTLAGLVGQEREKFAQDHEALWFWSRGLGLTAIICFLFAFGQIGFVKPVLDYEQYAWVMLVGGFLGLLLTVYLIVEIRRCRLEVQRLDDTRLNAIEDCDHERLLLQLEALAYNAAFVIGNVFYIVLFTKVYK